MPEELSRTIGRYRIIELIGESRWAAVYRALDPDGARVVAIKIRRQPFSDPEVAERVTREAPAAARLRHPNIVTIYNVGEDDGRLFIVMELVSGRTMADLIAHRDPLSVTAKVGMMEALASGLAYAHRAGIVHRRLRPTGLLIDHHGTLKIADFELAGTLPFDTAETVLDEFNYTSPEEIAGKPVDARADIFAAGAIFYELLSYQRAFPGSVQTGLLQNILNGEPEPLSRLVPDCDPRLVALVDRCLQKEPERRFPDMSAVHHELTRLRIHYRNNGEAHTGYGTPLGEAALAELRRAAAEVEYEQRRAVEAGEEAERKAADERRRPAVETRRDAMRLEVPRQVEREPQRETAVQAPAPARSTVNLKRWLLGRPIDSRPAVGGRILNGLKAAARTVADVLRPRGKPTVIADAARQANAAPLPNLAQVLLAVSAPHAVSPGSRFVARFGAYVEAREAAVKQQLRDLDPQAREGDRQIAVGLTPDRGGRWLIGTPVTVRVTGEHLLVDPPTRSFEWNGTENLVSFSIEVARDAPSTSSLLRFEAFIEGVSVALIPLPLRIGADVGHAVASVLDAHPASSAFASYASKDAPVVALCLSALKRWDPQLDVFMDCLDLTPNEQWQRELERVIPTKDTFLLFWSVNAKDSKWVAWELGVAESTKGIQYVRPMPIDDPDIAPPPEELKHLQFRDRYLMARNGFLRLESQRH